jgi:hypothetical protein
VHIEYQDMVGVAQGTDVRYGMNAQVCLHCGAVRPSPVRLLDIVTIAVRLGADGNVIVHSKFIKCLHKGLLTTNAVHKGLVAHKPFQLQYGRRHQVRCQSRGITHAIEARMGCSKLLQTESSLEGKHGWPFVSHAIQDDY